MTAGQILAWAAVITALATLVSAVGVLVKMALDGWRQLRQVTADTRSEVVAVKSLVNGNHSDLVARLDSALAQRDEARARSPREGDPQLPEPAP